MSQSEALVQLADQNQPGVGRDVRALELDFQEAVESELKRLDHKPTAAITTTDHLTCGSGHRTARHAGAAFRRHCYLGGQRFGLPCSSTTSACVPGGST